MNVDDVVSFIDPLVVQEEVEEGFKTLYLFINFNQLIGLLFQTLVLCQFRIGKKGISRQLFLGEDFEPEHRVVLLDSHCGFENLLLEWVLPHQFNGLVMIL